MQRRENKGQVWLVKMSLQWAVPESYFTASNACLGAVQGRQDPVPCTFCGLLEVKTEISPCFGFKQHATCGPFTSGNGGAAVLLKQSLRSRGMPGKERG